MTRIIAVVAAVALVGSSNAFTVPQSSLSQQSRLTTLFSKEDSSYTLPSNKFVECGVSMDQDGKSNIWSIEPKMEIENKSLKEKAGGILAGLGAM
ncbi:hypothetical protein HJC23_006056 [Cyclotella cryptica]|uniref:Uncharacterized protein n=1 Tax=Cyclotella cryptica TaxID=29204 RepID=A0ABD3PU26_9STRA|eukprot:CCRYP_011350-RA/>CCRYP_011350-RA protein AED:0.13 eAED:0.12 QI:0/0/0/1/1/1/2/0/94